MECGTTAFGWNRMSAESAHLSTFGAETEAEIRSTSSKFIALLLYIALNTAVIELIIRLQWMTGCLSVTGLQCCRVMSQERRHHYKASRRHHHTLITLTLPLASLTAVLVSATVRIYQWPLSSDLVCHSWYPSVHCEKNMHTFVPHKNFVPENIPTCDSSWLLM